VMMAGVIVAGVGVISHSLAWRNVDVVKRDRDPQRYLDDRDKLIIERDIAYGAYAVGGVVLATGLVLALTARSTGEGAQVSAAVTPGGATLSVAWSR
ncbi:MAG TPA: hypothetical protein VF516_14065, partial [Kofleriaceae bacterium]